MATAPKRIALLVSEVVAWRRKMRHAGRDFKRGRGAALGMVDLNRLPAIIRMGTPHYETKNGNLIYAAPSRRPGEARLVKVVVRLNFERKLVLPGRGKADVTANVVVTAGYVLPGDLSAAAGYERIVVE